MTFADPANVKPGDHAPVPDTRDSLLTEALRTANRMSGLLNDIAHWMHQEAEARENRSVEHPPLDTLEELLLRRFSDCSAVHLFIAASNLRLELPPDLNWYESVDDDDLTDDETEL